MAKQIEFDSLFNKGSFDAGVSELVKVISNITLEIGKAETAGKQLSEVFGKTLKKEISEISSTSKTLASDLAKMTAKMDDYKAKTAGVEKVTKEYKAEAARLTAELEKLKASQEKANKETDKAGTSAKGASTSYKGLAQSLLGVASGAALVYSGIRFLKEQLTLAVRSAMDFETAMKEVQAISRSSAEDLKELSSNANKLGATTEKTAGEVAGLQKELAKLGFDPTEIIASTKAIVDLSTATGEDLVSAGIVAAATLRAFGLEATEMGRVTDVMTGSFIRSGLDLEKFRESMKLVAPIAKATGVELEVVTASLSKLADTGISGSLAGTAMRNLLSSMADPSEDLTKLLGKLDSTLAGGVKTSEDFSKALVVLKKSNIDLETAVGMVDVRARSAFFTLVDQAEAIETLTLEYKLLNGETAEVASIMRDTLANDLEIANSAFDALRRNIVEAFIPSMRDTAQGVTTVIEYFRFLVDDLTEASEAMNKFGLASAKTYGLFQPFVDLYNSMAQGMKDTVAFRTAEEDLEQLGDGLSRVGLSMGELGSEFNKLRIIDQLISSGKFEEVIATAESFGAVYTDVVQGIKDQTITAAEGADILKGRIEGNLKTTKQQYEMNKLSYTQLLKDIDANTKFKEIEQAKFQEKKKNSFLTDKETEEHTLKMGQIGDQTFEMMRQQKVYEKFFEQYKTEANLLKGIKEEKKGVFDPKLLDGEKSKLKEQNKILGEKLKLENELSEIGLKRDLEDLKLKEKLEKSETLKLKYKMEALKVESELAGLRYDNEIRLLDALSKGDENYGLKKVKIAEEYYNKITKLQNGFVVDWFAAEESLATKLKNKTTELTKAGYAELDKLAKDQDANKKRDREKKKKTEEEEQEDREKIAEASAQALSMITTGLFDRAAINRSNELTAIDAWEQERIKLAGDNDEAIAAIEKEAQKRRNKIKLEQAKADKKEAIFQILIQTAVNIVKAWKNPLEMILAGALGAIQVAMVAARPLPKFEKGTDYSPEGHAIVGERGRELIKDGRSGNWRMSSDGASQTYLSRGSKVIPAHITAKILEGSHDHNGIAEQYLNKLSKKEEKELFDYNKLGEKFENAVTKIPVNQTNFDENGVTRFTIKRNSKIQRLNKRY